MVIIEGIIILKTIPSLFDLLIITFSYYFLSLLILFSTYFW